MFIYNRELTLQDLMNIDAGRMVRSKDLKIAKIDQYIVTNKPSFLGAFLAKLKKIFLNKPYEVLSKVLRYEIRNTKNGNTHIVIIKLPMEIDARKLLKQKVKIYCDCADFMYRCAYVLNDHNNLYLNKTTEDKLSTSLKTKPIKVNTSFACKHVYKAIEDLVDNYRNYFIIK